LPDNSAAATTSPLGFTNVMATAWRSKGERNSFSHDGWSTEVKVALHTLSAGIETLFLKSRVFLTPFLIFHSEKAPFLTRILNLAESREKNAIRIEPNC